jgi:hypothetical protein
MDIDAQHPTNPIPLTPASAPASPVTGGDGEGDERRGGKGPDRRKSQVDRRVGLERRQKSAAESGYGGKERRSGDERREDTGLERRRGPGRRRSDDRRSAEEGEMTGYQFEFVMAIETYKKVNKRMYPTWTEILEIIRQLGYRKVMKRTISVSAPEPGLLQLDADGEPLDE